MTKRTKLMDMAILWMVYAGALASLSNLCMRRSVDVCGSTKAFFIFQLFFTFLVSMVLFSFRNSLIWDSTIFGLGVCGGVAIGGMKVMIGKAIENGPSGLTFAAVNSACVLPAIIIFLFFSEIIDCSFTYWNGIGTLFVVFGLWWAGISASEYVGTKRIWACFAAFAFILHAFFLLITEYKLCLNQNVYADQYFVPTIFIAAAALHALLYSFTEKRIPHRKEIAWGMIGGIFNGACMYYFILAAEEVSSHQKAIIFPIFSVALIIFCNIWGQLVYREKVNWVANSFCLAGIILGSADWDVFLVH